MGCWVLDEACRARAVWVADDPGAVALTVFVNPSVSQPLNSDLSPYVATVVANCEFPLTTPSLRARRASGSPTGRRRRWSWRN